MLTLDEILAECNATAYPEPETPLHSKLIPIAVESVCQHLQKGATILDVGCGNGMAMRLFKAEGMAPTGVSVLQSECNAIRDAGMPAECFDMHKIPPTLGRWQCVFARHVLEHSPVPFLVLKLFRQLLNPGGLLYVEIPNPETSARHESNPNHWSMLAPGSWVNLILRAGFTVSSVNTIAFDLPIGPDAYTNILAHAV